MSGRTRRRRRSRDARRRGISERLAYEEEMRRTGRILDEGPGWYIVDESSQSSVTTTESESESLIVLIRTSEHLLRTLKKKRKRLEANRDEAKIADVVRQTLAEIVDVIGENLF